MLFATALNVTLQKISQKLGPICLAAFAQILRIRALELIYLLLADEHFKLR